jgi:hypothetical protein
MRLIARPNAPLILHVVTNDSREEIAMSANCKCHGKQPSMIIRGNRFCFGCNAAGIISRRSRTSARRALALISIRRTTLGSA